MTGFLASVRSPEEAALALGGGADIIDAKEPSAGALGRVDAETLAAIVRAIAGRRPVSATIGDLDLEPAGVAAAVEATAASGADIVKIGMFAGALDDTLAALRPIARRDIRLVAVLFADRAPDLAGIVSRCAAAGFYGVMLDTADKAAGPLTAHLGIPVLAGFVRDARRRRLVSGLAGSLRLADIAGLMPLGADYLGFRSALCAGGRGGWLDPASLQAVRRALERGAGQPGSSSATATAGAMSEAREARSDEAIGIVSSMPR
jgi:dihydroneopterin aldolase